MVSSTSMRMGFPTHSRTAFFRHALLALAAEQRKSETSTAASAAAPAAEQRWPTFSEDGEISRKLRSRAVKAGPAAVRIVDHASACSASVSSRVASICTSAGLHVRADLSCDQPTDDCGYIAADAVVRLRDAALAETQSWLTATLPRHTDGPVRSPAWRSSFRPRRSRARTPSGGGQRTREALLALRCALAVPRGLAWRRSFNGQIPRWWASRVFEQLGGEHQTQHQHR